MPVDKEARESSAKKTRANATRALNEVQKIYENTRYSPDTAKRLLELVRDETETLIRLCNYDMDMKMAKRTTDERKLRRR
jgi:hypothetical protein